MHLGSTLKLNDAYWIELDDCATHLIAIGIGRPMVPVRLLHAHGHHISVRWCLLNWIGRTLHSIDSYRHMQALLCFCACGCVLKVCRVCVFFRVSQIIKRPRLKKINDHKKINRRPHGGGLWPGRSIIIGHPFCLCQLWGNLCPCVCPLSLRVSSVFDVLERIWTSAHQSRAQLTPVRQAHCKALEFIQLSIKIPTKCIFYLCSFEIWFQKLMFIS